MDCKCVQCFSKSGTRSIRITYRVLRNVTYLALPETLEIRNSGGGTQQCVFSQAHGGLQMSSAIGESPLFCTTSQPFGFAMLVTNTASGRLLCGGSNNFPQVPPDSAFSYAWVPHVSSLF